MAAVFLFSGVLHDLAISVPARAGYGLPTLYFLLQAIGVEIERSAFGRRWHLRGGLPGWLFAATLILVPVCLLFHPPFIRHVVVPFLRVLGVGLSGLSGFASWRDLKRLRPFCGADA